MKIIADKELLLSKLQKVVKFIPQKAIIPVQEYFLFRIDREKLTVIANNGEMQATIQAEVKCEEAGSFCIPAKLLVSTMKLFREPEMYMTVKKKEEKVSIEIKCGNNKYTLSGEKADVFPVLPHPACQFEITMDGKTLKRGLATGARFANPKETQRIGMQGIKIAESGNKILFVGCQSAMFGKATMSPRAIQNWSDEVMMSVAAAEMVMDMVGGDDVVDLFHNKNKIVVQTHDLTIICSVIDAKQPDTEKFYRNKHPNKITLHTMETQDALKRVKLYSSHEFSQIIMELKGQQLEIYATDDYNNHSAIEIITMKDPAPKELRIAFNADLFLEILNSIEEPEVTLLYEAHNYHVFIDPIAFSEKEMQEKVVEKFEYLISPQIL